MSGDIERTACTADASCAATDSCTVKLDVLDDCAGRQVCQRAAGDRMAGTVCTAGSQCGSGTCLTAGRCYGACEDNLDCPNSLGCGIGAGSVELTVDVTATVNACGL